MILEDERELLALIEEDERDAALEEELANLERIRERCDAGPFADVRAFVGPVLGRQHITTTTPKASTEMDPNEFRRRGEERRQQSARRDRRHDRVTLFLWFLTIAVLLVIALELALRDGGPLGSFAG